MVTTFQGAGVDFHCYQLWGTCLVDKTDENNKWLTCPKSCKFGEEYLKWGCITILADKVKLRSLASITLYIHLSRAGSITLNLQLIIHTVWNYEH